jgi:flagellar basal body-associated protein FliL
VDSSVVGYDGGQNGTDEERSVWQRKPEREQKEETKQSRWGFRGKTVWDWMALLIVPLALVVIGLLFTMLQDARQQEIEGERAQQAQKIENQRAKAERELAEQRAQDEALQAYLDQMSTLMLEKDLRESAKDSEVRTLARARTLTVLSRLDSTRKKRLLQFL